MGKSIFFRKLFRYFLFVSASLILLAALAYVSAPVLIRSFVLPKISKVLGRTLTIDEISYNLFTGSLRLGGLSLSEREGEQGHFLRFDSLLINVELASIVESGLILSEVHLQNPHLNIVRTSANQYNFSDLIERFAAPSEEPKPVAQEDAFRFSVSNIRISGGSIDFDDKAVDEKHEIRALTLTLPFLSNMPYALDSFAEPGFSAEIDGAPIRIEGKTKPLTASLETELAVNFENLKLAPFFEYLPLRSVMNLESGTLNSQLKLKFHQKNKVPSLDISGNLQLNKLDLRDSASQKLLAWEVLDIDIKSADIFERRFVVDRILLDTPEGMAQWNQEGVLNWLSLRQGSQRDKQAVSTSPTSSEQTGKRNTGAQQRKPSVSPAKIAEASDTSTEKRGAPAFALPFKADLSELRIKKGRLRIFDQSRTEPFKMELNGFELDLKNLSTEPDRVSQIKTAFKLDQGGELELEGEISPLQSAGELKLALRGLALLPFQTYFADRINVVLTRGALSTSGQLKFKKTPVGMLGNFSGEMSFSDFKTVDKQKSADIFTWKSLSLGKIDFNLQPMSLKIGDIVLSDFFARLILTPEGRLNVFDIMRRATQSATRISQEQLSVVQAQAQSAETKRALPSASVGERPPPFVLTLDKITLQGGDIRFTDSFIKPNYTANLKKINGSLTGLSSEPGTMASLSLRGSYSNIAPIVVTAKINPLLSKPYVDLEADVRGVELTSLSTYAEKYAGYAIEKGKLSLNIKYKIEDNELRAENRLFLDQLTFGEPSDSPSATKLPVNLAIALLKNSRGEININLPISGSLNDPEFSIGGLIFDVFVNLITKAVTSPFSLLSSLFGDGEEISMIEFDPGTAILEADDETRLTTLGSALRERPALKLEITGMVDLEKDLVGLKRASIDDKVRALKRGDLIRRGVKLAEDERITVSKEEYPALLERAYQAEKFSKPRNMIGMQKSLPIQEMEKLMMENMVIENKDLRELAEERSRIVQEWLVSHNIVADRVFVLPPKLIDPRASTEGEKAPASRVQFSLR